eukprot:Opistho-2@3378
MGVAAICGAAAWVRNAFLLALFIAWIPVYVYLKSLTRAICHGLHTINKKFSRSLCRVTCAHDLRPEGEFALLSQGRIHYVLRGNPKAELLVLLPGFTLFSWSWKAIADLLVASGYRVLCFDYYGSGFSSSPAGVTHDVDFYVHQTMELLSTIGMEQAPFTLVGFSLGGLVACSIAAQYPHEVQRLVLVSPGGFPVTESDQSKSAIRFVSQLAYRGTKTIVGESIIDAACALTVATLGCLPLLRRLAGPPFNLTFFRDRKGRPLSRQETERHLGIVGEICNHLAFQVKETPDFFRNLLLVLRRYPLFSNEGVVTQMRAIHARCLSCGDVRTASCRTSTASSTCDACRPPNCTLSRARRMPSYWKLRMSVLSQYSTLCAPIVSPC